jgi:hypothetical protein
MIVSETVLWAVKVGDANWQEQLITSTSDKAKVAKAREWAQANGFNRFRESHFDGTAPDFTKTLNH